MSSNTKSGIIHIEKIVSAPVEAAFSTFTERTLEWWPREYTWASDELEAMHIEPAPGGRCIERDSQGNERVWGTVLTWEAPHRIVFSWQIGPAREQVADPADASEIEVRFEELSPSETTFTFEHRHFERHGDNADDYRDALATPQGWQLILDRYAESLG